MYRNRENMLNWTKHFKIICSLKTACEISLKIIYASVWWQENQQKILLNAMGRKRVDVAPSLLSNLPYYTIRIWNEWLWERNIIVVQNFAILAQC